MSTSTAEIPSVLFVIGGLGQGGSEGQLTALALASHPHSLQVTIGTLSDDRSPHRQRLERHGIEVVSLRRTGRHTSQPLRPVGSLLRLLRLTVRRRPSVIYAWLEESAVVGAGVAWCAGVPLVVARRNVIGSRLDAGPWPLSRLVSIMERRAQVVTVNSRAGADFASARGIAGSRLRLVQNGHPTLPALPMPTAAEGVVFGCVARFRPEKGHLRLLDALALLDRGGKWSVRFAGDGECLDLAKRRAAVLGIAGRLEFLGPVDDVRAFWSTCHVALLASDHEGQPNALIEAAFAGRAAVATAVGGTPEVVGPDGGLLAAPEPGALAAAMATFVEDPGSAIAMGAAAHRQAVERFSAEAMRSGHLAAIREAIG